LNRQRSLHSASFWRGNLEPVGFSVVSLSYSHFVRGVARGDL